MSAGVRLVLRRVTNPVSHSVLPEFDENDRFSCSL